MIEQRYTMQDIINSFGIDRECIRSWMKGGYVSPSIQYATGPGRAPENRHIFSAQDLGYILAFRKLVQSGMSCELAKRVLT